ncbi:MAG TPA: ribosome maturation factor RimM [Anaerolineae bacterium]|nr:ribosome maturation factor RimM [Anaerolineae bacterium]
MTDAAQRRTRQRDRGSGRLARAPEPRFLAIGQVAGAHGIRGELKVEILTEEPARFGRLKRVYLGREGEDPQPRGLEAFRLHLGKALLKIEGCDDRTAAEALRGALLQVPIEEAIPLKEGEYYEHQIVGLPVWTTAGESLGEVDEILYTGANDVYVVRGAGGREILVPAIAGVIVEVDLEAGRLVVELLEGLR